MFESRLHGALRNLVERYTLNTRRSLRFALLCLLTLLLLSAIVVEFKGKMRSDGFAFAVRFLMEIDLVRRGGQLLQLGNNFLLSRNDDVILLEIVGDINTQTSRREILHMTEG